MNLQELSFISRTLLSSQPSIAYTWGDRPRLVSPTRLFLRDFASSGPGLSLACLSWPGPALLALAVVCKVFAPHRGQSPGSRDSQPELLPFFIEDKTWRDLSREIQTGFENFFTFITEHVKKKQSDRLFIKYARIRPDWNRILSIPYPGKCEAAWGQKVCKCRISNQD